MRFICKASQLGNFMKSSRKKGELGDTCKTVILDKALFDVLGYKKPLNVKTIKKGLALEDDAIRAVSLLKAVIMTKNTERRENDWFTGECDLLTSNSIRDTKCSWSIDSFPWTQSDAEKKVKESGYDWQGQVYMYLWDMPVHYVDFVLLPTPENLLGFGDDPIDHIETVNQIPLQKRIKSVEIKRNDDLIKQAMEKIDSDLVQNYYKEVCAELSNN